MAGLIGGRLPGLLMHWNTSLSSVEAKRVALLAGSGFAALAIVPALFLRFSASPKRRKREEGISKRPVCLRFFRSPVCLDPRDGWIQSFFQCLLLAKPPFRRRTDRVIFSYGQLAQVVAILAAPAVVSKLTEVRGIAAMQVGTAAMLACLAVVSSPLGGVGFYVAYMCFQYMSAPCLLSMLMTRVGPSEQSGASAP